MRKEAEAAERARRTESSHASDERLVPAEFLEQDHGQQVWVRKPRGVTWTAPPTAKRRYH